MVVCSSFLSPLGCIYMCEEQGVLVSVSYFKPHGVPCNGRSVILEKAKTQFAEYFKGERKKFDLPIELQGTYFQKKVWQALLEIPYGETRSYKDIAIAIGNPKAVRAVGGANNKNPLSIIVPCHRVVGANKSLVGYAGGLDKKELLLNLEKQG